MYNLILKYLKEYWYYPVIILLLIFLSITLKQCNHQTNDLRISNKNIKSLSDSVRTTKNKASEEQKRKLELILDLDNLKSVNSDLYNEVNKLTNKDKKNLIEITKLSGDINLLKDSIESIRSNSTKLNDSTYRIDFDKSDKYRNLTGFSLLNIKTNVGNTFLTKDNINLDLTISKIKTKDGIEIVASSTNPYVKIDKIDGVLIKPEVYSELVKPDKKWNVSVSAGYGYTLQGFQPFVGVTVGRTIIKF